MQPGNEQARWYMETMQFETLPNCWLHWICLPLSSFLGRQVKAQQNQWFVLFSILFYPVLFCSFFLSIPSQPGIIINIRTVIFSPEQSNSIRAGHTRELKRNFHAWIEISRFRLIDTTSQVQLVDDKESRLSAFLDPKLGQAIRISLSLWAEPRFRERWNSPQWLMGVSLAVD